MSRTPNGLAALLVPVDGEIRDVVIRNHGDSHLESLYELVGCTDIEHVRAPGCSLWIDGEGAICSPPKLPNRRIDALLQRPDGWSIRGDVLVAGEVGPDGATRGLTAARAAELRAWFAAAGLDG